MTRGAIAVLAVLAGCRGEPAPESPAPDGGAPAEHAGHDQHPMPEGYAEVTVPEDRRQLMGVRTATVKRVRLADTIRASAVVQADETLEAHIHSKVLGWVVDLFVTAIGQTVEKDQPLYSIYSQDVFVTELDYLRARKVSHELAAAARERLRLWDVPEDQIRRIETSGAVHSLTVRSPIRGTVLEKSVFRGHYVEPSKPLYRIADLSRVWVIADVYEFEAGAIDRKGTAQVTVQGAGDAFDAAIDYVYPTVDPVSRTVKVRLVAQNPKGLLRPGSFATAHLPRLPVDALTVPEEAVIDTGVRQIVFVAVAEGRYRPVEVTLGRAGAGLVEIRKGLKEGTKVAVSAQFLLDSESRIRGASGSGPAHSGH